MSKLFFDRLLELKRIDKEIKKVAKTSEEREELWALVDEILHHKVLGCILDRIPKENHEEFLEIYHKSPHDEEMLFGYLRSKIGEDAESILKQEIDLVSTDLLREFSSKTK